MTQFFGATSFSDTLLWIMGILTILLLALPFVVGKEPRSFLEPNLKRWGLIAFFFSIETLALVWLSQGSHVLQILGLTSPYELLPASVSFLVIVRRFTVVFEILCAVVALTLALFVLRQSQRVQWVFPPSLNHPAPAAGASYPKVPAEEIGRDRPPGPPPPAR